MKILYVEDNEDNIYMLRSRLARAGFTVVVATDGAQGVAMAASEQPDLVLMDLSLPGLDGWEAARRIKATRRPSGSIGCVRVQRRGSFVAQAFVPMPSSTSRAVSRPAGRPRNRRTRSRSGWFPIEPRRPRPGFAGSCGNAYVMK